MFLKIDILQVQLPRVWLSMTGSCCESNLLTSLNANTGGTKCQVAKTKVKVACVHSCCFKHVWRY